MKLLICESQKRIQNLNEQVMGQHWEGPIQS